MGTNRRKRRETVPRNELSAASSSDGPCIPPGTPAWITRELIELTIRVWQPYYAALLTTVDAVTMILGAGHLYTALSRSTNHETVRSLGPRQQP
jgi:hypothetical protein